MHRVLFLRHFFFLYVYSLFVYSFVENLRFVRADEVPWDEYHGRYVSRDTAARQEWREVLKKGAAASLGVFAYDAVRMGLRQGDERIRDILPA